MRASSLALTLLVSVSSTSNAWGWDPNAGAEDTTQPVARYKPITQTYTPQRSYTPVAITPATPMVAPVATVAPQPAVIAPLPEVAAASAPAPAIITPTTLQQPRNVPAENYAAPAPVAVTAPTGPSGQTAYIAPYYPSQSSAAPAYKANRYSVGVEGFWDRYREPSVDLESNSGYGALDGSWTHYYNPSWFSTTELRGSYGQENYKSTSGTLDGVDQWEFEGRLLGGYDVVVSNGHLKTYLGLDARYYRDEGKGGVTNLGFNAYDRRIFQVMLPIGMTYDMQGASGFHYIPTIEGGPLLYGNVSTRLENINGYPQLTNHQNSGYELRGEFMMSKLNDQGRGFEFGPFVRYWHFEDSTTDHTSPAPNGATAWIEPKNSRLQVGAKLGYLF